MAQKLAIYSCNLPKFTMQDDRLFNGLTKGLFPTVPINKITKQDDMQQMIQTHEGTGQ